MTPYIQHEPTNMKGRGGVTAITVYMTNEEKVRLVNSVYSNIKKLTIAQMIFIERGCTNERLSEALRMTPGGITRMTNEMLATGVIVEEQRSYYTVFKITRLGKKLLSFTGE